MSVQVREASFGVTKSTIWSILYKNKCTAWLRNTKRLLKPVLYTVTDIVSWRPSNQPVIHVILL